MKKLIEFDTYHPATINTDSQFVKIAVNIIDYQVTDIVEDYDCDGYRQVVITISNGNKYKVTGSFESIVASINDFINQFENYN